jgi:hypothetical protein
MSTAISKPHSRTTDEARMVKTLMTTGAGKILISRPISGIAWRDQKEMIVDSG